MTELFFISYPEGVLTEDLDIYVSALNGNDVNNGLSPATAKQTLAGAYALIPVHIAANVLVHVASGIYEFEPLPTFLPVTPTAAVWVSGDGAGQPGDVGYEVVATGTVVTVTDSGRSCTTDLPINVYDEYTGLQFRVVSGLATGVINAVRRCLTPSTIELSAQRSVGTFLAGDSIQLTRPTAIILPSPGAWPSTAAIGGNVVRVNFLTETGSPVMLVNIMFRGLSTQTIQFSNGTYSLFGVTFDTCNVRVLNAEVTAAQTVTDLTVMNAMLTRLGYTINVAVARPWDGWGWMRELQDFTGLISGGAVVTIVAGGRLNNHVIDNFIFMGQIGSEFRPQGGRVGAVQATEESVVRIGSSNQPLMDSSANVNGLLFLSTQSYCETIGTTKWTNRGTGPAISVAAGVVRIGGTMSGSIASAGVPAVVASAMGQVLFTVAPTLVGGTPGSDLQVLPAAAVANATLTSGTGIVNASLGARIART